MQKSLAVLAAFLVVMAWQYRKNKAALFAIIATLFALAALITGGSRLPERSVTSLAIAWAVCMLIAIVFAVEKLLYFARRKMKQS